MSCKQNEKQYDSSILLYQRLKQVLLAEKTNNKLYPQLINNQSQYIGNKKLKQPLIFNSLSINDLMLQNHQYSTSQQIEGIHKSKVKFFDSIKIKKQQNFGPNKISLTNKKMKKIPYFQVFRKKNAPFLNPRKNSLQIKNSSLFTNKQNQKLIQKNPDQLNNQEAFAYSLMLKNFNFTDPHTFKVSETEKSLTNKDKIQFQIGNRFSKNLVENSAIGRFLKNSRINKGIQFMEQLKRDLSQQVKQNLSNNHFPEFQTLNQSYFTSSKKHLFNRISSRTVFSQCNNETKLKLFLNPSYKMIFKNHARERLKTQNKEISQKSQISNLKTDFSYYIYQYKTSPATSQNLFIQSRSPSAAYKPKRQKFSQKSPKKTVKFNNYHLNSPNTRDSKIKFDQEEVTHNFIYKNCQTANQEFKSRSVKQKRSLTANIKRMERHETISQYEFRQDKKVMKTIELKKRGLAEDNFVKPWQNAGNEGQAGF